jgi:hypothetical protein
MVIDYRALNPMTIKDRFPIPYLKSINKLQGKKFCPKMDLNPGYHQGRVASEDIEKNAFIRSEGLWKWLAVLRVSQLPLHSS